jgi:hypothetical protein
VGVLLVVGRCHVLWMYVCVCTCLCDCRTAGNAVGCARVEGDSRVGGFARLCTTVTGCFGWECECECSGEVFLS